MSWKGIKREKRWLIMYETQERNKMQVKAVNTEHSIGEREH